jgi:hypothetical protein
MFNYRINYVLNNLFFKLKELFTLNNNIEQNDLHCNWSNLSVNRIAIVNFYVNKFSRPISYLEIGCFKNELFYSVPVLNKVGVDPICGGNYRNTSDSFFEHNESKFDVIFIDGLHQYDQVWKDVKNSLSCLSPDGYILIHDVLPRNSKEQNLPRITSEWLGDCWKILFDIHDNPFLDLKIISADHGIAVVTFSSSINDVSLSKSYDDFTFDFYKSKIISLDILDPTSLLS